MSTQLVWITVCYACETRQLQVASYLDNLSLQDIHYIHISTAIFV